jgi:hypothetical protein
MEHPSSISGPDLISIYYRMLANADPTGIHGLVDSLEYAFELVRHQIQGLACPDQVIILADVILAEIGPYYIYPILKPIFSDDFFRNLDNRG